MSFNTLFHEPAISVKSYCIVVRTAAQTEPSLMVFILNKGFARNFAIFHKMTWTYFYFISF